MNIILTGYRATGKTTIGKILANRLSKTFIDTDDIIEQREGMKIRDIFEQKGWKYFRKVEKRVVRSLARLDNHIIAVGGGTFMYKDNLLLTQNAIVVLLIAPIEVIAERIKNDPNRPPLTEAQSSVYEIKEVWGRRKERYYTVSNIVCDTSTGDGEKLADEIIRKLDILS